MNFVFWYMIIIKIPPAAGLFVDVTDDNYTSLCPSHSLENDVVAIRKVDGMSNDKDAGTTILRCLDDKLETALFFDFRFDDGNLTMIGQFGIISCVTGGNVDAQRSEQQKIEHLENILHGNVLQIVL